MGLIFFIIFLYLPLFFVLYLITQNLLQKLQNLPPSPFLTFPIIGNIYLLQQPMHKTLHRLSKKYGHVFSLQFGSRLTLIVSSPSAAAECLSKTNDAIFANRPQFLNGKHLGCNFTSISWAPHGDHWRNLRKISSVELLSSHRINSLSRIRQHEVKTVIRHLSDISSENPGSPIVMRAVIFELLYNFVTGMIFGKRYYGKGTEANTEEAKKFQEFMRQINELITESMWNDYIPSLRWFTKVEKKYEAIQERTNKFLQDMIDGIRERDNDLSPSDDKPAKTMIEVLLSLRETNPEYYTDDIIKCLSLVLLGGGSDSSVATMEWAMTLLLNNPHVLKTVQNEIDTHVGHDRLIDDSDLSELPYLNCVINETLRMYPIGPLLMPHESSEDCTVGGFHVPRGTILFVNVWAVQNDPEVWDDPGTFKPERFMTEEGKMTRKEFKHIPFGNGRRKCPGEALAMRMIGLGLGSLIQCFDWKRISDDDEELEDVTENIGIVTSKDRPLMARCWPRTSLVNLLSRI